MNHALLLGFTQRCSITDPGGVLKGLGVCVCPCKVFSPKALPVPQKHHLVPPNTRDWVFNPCGNLFNGRT